MNYDELVNQAYQAQKKAYVPYSHFPVGAALLTEDDQVYLGCNIENAAYSMTNCAERTAVFKAVSEGQRRFKAIAVVANTEDYCTPCGACRQVLTEFSPEMDVILVNKKGEKKIVKASELLPGFFSRKDMKE